MALVSRTRESAVARSFVASAILTRYDFYSTPITFEEKFIQFYSCTLSHFTWHFLIRRANPSLVEIGDMSVTTPYSKDMTRLARKRRRRNFLRISIKHLLCLFAQAHHQIIVCEIL